MAAERKGADLEPLPLNFGIEETDSLSYDDTEYLLDNDPEDVNPIHPPQTEVPSTVDKKVPALPTQSPKAEQKKEDEEVSPSLETDDFFDDEENNDQESSSESQQDEEVPEEGGVNEFQTYSEALLHMGIFSLDEGEESLDIKNGDDFKARWQHERKKDAYNMLDKAISRFGKKHQDFIVAALNGVDPDEYYSVYSNVENISNLDITKEEHQKTVYREALRRQGLSNEKIEKQVQRAVELGDLEDYAKDYHEVLLRQEQERLADLEAQKEQELIQKQQARQQYENGIRTILSQKMQEKEFDGIPVNDKVAREIYDFLITEKYQLPDGELLTEFDRYFLELKRPENYEKRLKVALLFHSDLNLEGVKKVVLSKETNDLFAGLKKNTKSKKPTTTAKKSTPPPTPPFKFDYSE
jgi:hypothetical protein